MTIMKCIQSLNRRGYLFLDSFSLFSSNGIAGLTNLIFSYDSIF